MLVEVVGQQKVEVDEANLKASSSNVEVRAI